MKIIYTGLESSGKTLFLAEKLMELLKRNIRWYKKYGWLRPIYTNLRLTEKYLAKYREFITYWDNVNDIIGVSGCDILWDELSSDFSALKKEPLSKQVNRWLRQGAKQGVHIYATAQEYHDVHLDCRRRFQEAWKCHKLFGSPRGGEHLPPVKHLWGFCWKRRLCISPYNELLPVEMGFPDFIWIGKDVCSVFDTYQIIKDSLEAPPLEHIVRSCPVCGIRKTFHR